MLVARTYWVVCFIYFARLANVYVYMYMYIHMYFGVCMQMCFDIQIFSQEGVDGVYANIQCLRPDGCHSYVLGAAVESPVADIDIVVPAPQIIKQYPSGSTLSLPMISEVCQF